MWAVFIFWGVFCFAFFDKIVWSSVVASSSVVFFFHCQPTEGRWDALPIKVFFLCSFVFFEVL